MSPSLELLLTHYRRELADLMAALHPEAALPCPPGEELLWAEAGEAGGWLRPDRAMELRRLATRVRYYERRSRGG